MGTSQRSLDLSGGSAVAKTSSRLLMRMVTEESLSMNGSTLPTHITRSRSCLSLLIRKRRTPSLLAARTPPTPDLRPTRRSSPPLLPSKKQLRKPPNHSFFVILERPFNDENSIIVNPTSMQGSEPELSEKFC